MKLQILSTRAWPVACVALALGCAGLEPKRAEPSNLTAPPGAPQARREESWATSSPQASEGVSGFALELERRCGVGDNALTRAARSIGHELKTAERELDPSAVVESLRRAGAPYVWPRAWTRWALPGAQADTLERMSAWLGSFGDGGERRCGVALEHANGGRELAVVIAVDALADLRPVPVRTRLASWVDVEADLLVPAQGAKVVVLGPRGSPKPVPTSAAEARIHARFNADQPGPWLVQVLADVAGGPRPVLEAQLFAGIEPDDFEDARRAPGEELVANDLPSAALESMLAAARREENLRPLVREAALDRIAHAHAEEMRERRRLAHDVGIGDPTERIGQAGLPIVSAGENVAHAANARRAQRALWASPSHRANLLNPRFDIVGIGVAEDHDGSLWVCELFAERTR